MGVIKSMNNNRLGVIKRRVGRYKNVLWIKIITRNLLIPKRIGF